MTFKIFSRVCNLTHTAIPGTTAAHKIKHSLPQLFQSSILCAGPTVGLSGSCQGDSGGPLMYLLREQGQCEYF
jgi:secreted trypsin-like serine protease